MTNEQIIAEIAASIYSPDEIAVMTKDGGEIPLHTALGWRMRGPYKVKEGEKGIETKLWKRRKRSPDYQEDCFYLSKAYLFRKEQMELMDKRL